MRNTFLQLKIIIATLCALSLLGGLTPLNSTAESVTSPRGSVTKSKASLSPESAENETWRFVVFGDTRDATQDTLLGISPYLNELAKSIAAEKPKLVLHLGDLINGYYTHKSSPVHDNYTKMFDNWKTAVQPIFDFNTKTGIPIYAVRGNHEDGELVTNKALKDAYLQEIAPFMPQNGPEQEKGLTYSVTYRKATFIGLDEYSIKELGILRGLINQPWLDKELVRTRNPFMFVFGHVPAYKVADEKNGPFPDLYFFPKSRDAFWDSLKKAGVSIYFCGHVHFYSRVTKDGIQQVLVGDGGANPVDFILQKIDPTVTVNYPKTDVKSTETYPSYVVFTVNEAKGTVTAVQKIFMPPTGPLVTGDSFSVKASF